MYTSRFTNEITRLYEMPATLRVKLIEDYDTVDERNKMSVALCFAHYVAHQYDRDAEDVLESLEGKDGVLSEETKELFKEFIDASINTIREEMDDDKAFFKFVADAFKFG